ncbi:hypothetical protein OROGR_007404 [Orobanche gracilis]
MLDINLFREEKGNNPEIIRESQRRRFASVGIVDEIIHLDKEWRQGQFELEQLRKDFNRINREVAKLRTSGEDASSMIRNSEEIKDSTAKKALQVDELHSTLLSKLELVGNLVHDSVPVSNAEVNNVVVRAWGEKRTEPNLKNHVELVELLEIVDLKKGEMIGGKGGVFLKDDGIDLNQALINFGLDFLEERGFQLRQPPMFMTNYIMGKRAQFDKELYKVTGDGDDKYLIAAAEQPLCAYHIDDWIHPTKLPLRYVGYSTCFRKGASCDTLGIFNANQFQEVVQLCITGPNGNDSWDMHEEMIKNSEEFFQMLKLPYRIVPIVSGAVNGAASKTYDLEAWFPASNTYRELVSCSNCTDYQSRKLEIRFGQKSHQQTKQYCHLLNSALTDTHRTMCCILENYQREGGVEVPEVLQPYMDGIEFIPFQAPSPVLDSTLTDTVRKYELHCL